MAKVRVTHGDGITAREVDLFHPGTAETELDESLDAWTKAGENNFERRVSNAKRWAASVLKAAGIDPDEDGLTEDGTADTENNFARRIYREIQIARACIGSKDAVEAARSGIELGILIASAEVKFSFEKAALRGKPFIESRRGQSLLYRKAEQILRAHNGKRSNKQVRLDLEKALVVEEIGDLGANGKDSPLKWLDDEGEKQETPFKAFENGMTRIRRKVKAEGNTEK